MEISSYTKQLQSQETGIILSDSYKGQKAKVVIPILTPNARTDKAYNDKVAAPVPSNIVSDSISTITSKLGLKGYEKSNYIELKTPKKVFEQDKVYVTILGSGNLNNIEIAGEYNG